MTATVAPFQPFDSDDKPSGASADDYVYVALPSGAQRAVLTQDEAEHLETRVLLYDDQLSLHNVSDVATLDSVVGLELLIYRYQEWLSRRRDYDGKSVDENQLQQRIKELSTEIRLLKKGLGIDKVSRDRARGEGSMFQRVENVLDRAQAFGYMRNAQSARAVELAMQAISLVDVHQRCTPEEREQFHYTAEDIVEWLDTIFRPEFLVIDEKFRNEGPAAQKMWIRDM